MPRALFLVLLIVLGLLAPSVASAQRCVAPPGTSAVDEYCETVPSAGGDRGAGDHGGGSGASISPGTVAALARSGKDGQALDRALGKDPSAVRPRKPTRGDKKAARGSDATKGKHPLSGGGAASAPPPNPLNAVGQAISGGATMGSWFVLALLAVALLMLGWGWVAYRRRSS